MPVSIGRVLGRRTSAQTVSRLSVWRSVRGENEMSLRIYRQTPPPFHVTVVTENRVPTDFDFRVLHRVVEPRFRDPDHGRICFGRQ